MYDHMRMLGSQGISLLLIRVYLAMHKRTTRTHHEIESFESVGPFCLTSIDLGGVCTWAHVSPGAVTDA